MVYVILLKLLMSYADIRFLQLCPWLESKPISFWKAFKMTMITVHNTFLTGIMMHIACGYKIIRTQLDRWQIIIICLTTLTQYLLDFTSQILWLNHSV